jgi:hypothetical protein
MEVRMIAAGRSAFPRPGRRKIEMQIGLHDLPGATQRVIKRLRLKDQVKDAKKAYREGVKFGRMQQKMQQLMGAMNMPYGEEYHVERAEGVGVAVDDGGPVLPGSDSGEGGGDSREVQDASAGITV